MRLAKDEAEMRKDEPAEGKEARSVLRASEISGENGVLVRSQGMLRN